MANPSLQIGNGKWAIKEDNLLGYSTAGSRFVPQPITMTRATLGTRVNPQGLVEDVALLGSELVTNGDFATDTDWTKNDWDISNGVATLPTTSTSNLNQDIGLEQYKFYKIVFTVSNTTLGGVRVRLGTSTISSVFTDGTHTIYLEQTTTNDAFRFYADSSGVFNGSIDNVSVKEATIDNLPRVDYTDGTSSLLVEPERTNNLQSTQDFTDTFWNTNNMETIVASTVLSPDGTTFGYKATPNNTTNKHYVDYDFGFLSMPSGVEVTYSVFAKPNGYTNFQLASSTSFASRYQNFELTGDGVIGTGDVNSAKIEKIGDWYRCSITETTTGTTPRVLNIATPSSGLGRNPTWLGNGTDGVLLWGAQIEEGTCPTSYIPNLSTTSGSTVTRNQETYTKTGISDKINSEEGVLFVEMAALSDDLTNRILGMSDGTFNNSVLLRYASVSNRITAQVRLGGVYQCTLNYSVTDVLDFHKIAFKYKVNDFALWIDGVERATDTSGDILSGLDELSLSVSSSNEFFGKIRQLQVFKTALSDSELATLTT